MKIDAIKKGFKKIIIILCCLMLFLFPPKLNDDFVFQDNPNVMEVEAGAVTTTYLTWEAMKAAAVAAGSAVAPVAVGVVAVAAIGLVVDETIGWDVVADYGQGIINHVVSLGGTVADIFNAETETVNLTSEFVDGAAVAVDSLPDSKIVDYGEWMALPSLTINNNNKTQLGWDFNIRVSSAEKAVIRGDYVIYGGHSNPFRPILRTKYTTTYLSDPFTANFPEVLAGVTQSGNFEAVRNLQGGTLEMIGIDTLATVNGRSVTLSNVRMVILPKSGTIPEDVAIEDYTSIKDTLPATVDARKELMTNTIGGIGTIALQDTQAVTGVTFPEMVSANTPEDLDESSGNDLGVLGILPMIYNLIKSLPVRIVGAFTSLFNTIINAIKAIPSAISSGVDSLVNNMIALGNTLAGSLDDFLIDVNALGNSIVGGLDELLIDVNALANSIAGSFGGLLINLGTWFDSLLNGIGAIPGTIADAMTGLKSWLGSLWDTLIGLLSNIWDFIAGLAEWIIALVVPTSLVGIQPSITSLTNTFNQKFEFILFPIRSFGNAYSESKSLYDVTFNLKYKDIDKDVHVLPIAYKPAVDVFRFVANGVVVVLTYISMYNRFRKEVLAE